MIDKKDDEGWIKITDAMPAVGQEVYIKSICKTLGDLRKYIYKVKFKNTGSFSFGFISDDGSEYSNVIKWKPIPERKPDFGKLKKGDFIIFEYSSAIGPVLAAGILKEVQFLREIEQERLILYVKNNFCGIWDFYDTDKIKKITLINLEDKTFEEI